MRSGLLCTCSVSLIVVASQTLAAVDLVPMSEGVPTTRLSVPRKAAETRLPESIYPKRWEMSE